MNRNSDPAANAYTVTRITHYIQNMFQNDYLLNRVCVKGEVSNCKYHPKGHIYFTLKDAESAISCVMFSGSRSGLAFRMENGQQVIVTGSVEVYSRDGKYQLYAKRIQQEGQGSLYERFRLMKEELEEMGMFDPSYKKEIPSFSNRIGIVTASSGAAIRDIQNISRRRNPYVQLILCPALVQGEGAAASIAKGISRLEALNVDVIIVGRGGGSMEDLWAFNERVVADAIFRCSVPVISAVGHETDTTISDYVADLRAPTPSAAAELAVWDYSLFQEKLFQIKAGQQRLMAGGILKAKERLGRYDKRIMAGSPMHKLQEKQYRLAQIEDGLYNRMKQRIRDARSREALFAARLDGLSPLKKLESGYAYVQAPDQKALRSINQLHIGDRVQIYVADGTLDAKVEKLHDGEVKWSTQ